jgi:hypothetical protein
MQQPNANLIFAEQQAAQAVAQLFGSTGGAFTQVEALLWATEIHRLGPDLAMEFVRYWASGEHELKYKRTPTINDFLSRVDPEHLSAETGFAKLQEEVRLIGGWRSPAITNLKLLAAIERLGGWPKVCAELPSPTEDFALRAYAEKFALAWRHSEGLKMQGLLGNTPPALGAIDLNNRRLAQLGYQSKEAKPSHQVRADAVDTAVDTDAVK